MDPRTPHPFSTMSVRPLVRWIRGAAGRGAWLALALLLVGLGLTTWVARTMHAKAKEAEEREFVVVCREIQILIEHRLHEHEQILRSGAAVFADTDGVSREEWHEYAERQKINQTLPGIQGIGFAQLVPREQLAEHVRQVRAGGFPDYRVWPEGNREIYSSIVYLEPCKGANLRALGYDMFSEAVRRAAMERARDQDDAILSAKVTLVQESGKTPQAGTLMYAPVYRMGAACATLAERRAAIIGWVYSPYRMTDLMEGILSRRSLVAPWKIRLAIFDGETSAAAALLYDSEAVSDSQPRVPAFLTRQTVVDSSGRPWLLRFTQLNPPSASVLDGEVVWVWASGVAISLLLAGLALTLANTRRKAQLLARGLTADLRHSEVRWKFAVEGAGDGVWDWDVVTGQGVFSARWKEQLGYAAHELGSGVEEWSSRVHPEDLPRVMADAQAHLDDSRVPYCNEHRLRCKDGSWKWILDRGLVVSRDAEGKALRMIGTHKDITDRKQIEAELLRQSRIEHALMLLATRFVNVPREQEEAAIEELLATMGRLIDIDRIHVFAYDFAKGFASNTHEWCGTGIQSQVHKLQTMPLSLYQDFVVPHRRGEPKHIPSVADLPVESTLRQVLESLGVRSLVTLPLMNDGECQGFVVFDAIREQRLWQASDVALLGVLAELYSNFTARRAADRQGRELQQGIAAARDEAQAAAAAKGLFLANMSHEIRTPLNAILGYVQIMERERQSSPPRNGPNQDWLKAIHRSGQHLLALLNDLLDLVRSDARVITPNPSDFDFHQVLEDVRLMFIPLPEAQGLSLEEACAPQVPRFLHADPGKVRQILVNLVGNALKFTTTGGVRLTASVLSEGSEAGFLLAVDIEDTGCGIGPDELEHIFEVFEQAEYGRKSGKGTGLGLPLSRRYARALGGDVTVIHSSSAGSHFRFTFHATAANRTTSGQLLEASAWQYAGPLPAPSAEVDPAALAHLSAEQFLFLEQALHGGDIDLLHDLITAISHEDPKLAAGLRVLLEAYDYQRLRDLLQTARAQKSKV